MTLKLVIRMMPCNVVTYWNLMYIVLNFVLEYREASNKFTGDRGMDVRFLKLDEEE